MYKSGPENVFAVTDAVTGERVVDGTRISRDDGEAPSREKWAVTFASGPELAWMYKTDPPEISFYDSAGNPMMVTGHHIPFEPPSKGGTFRVLLSMWGAAAKSTEEYAAVFDDRAIASVVPASEVPLLPLLGMWLERRWDIKGRGADGGFS